ncbi:MAG TPA: molybdopterin-guanine dinucleotide biosynthesis protein B [Desulfurivibrionaceae bacterium]|nr:molybdopterin-guanine dinucleotide biosynthesis protein B [Desulfurivibrionaceae bacterium]
MPPVITFVGKPDCGKTTLLEKLIPELNRRGLKVGTIKHHVHAFEMDREGKDTWRHKRAGAKVVALSSPTGLGVIRDTDHDPAIPELLDRYFFDVDLVLAEGYKHTDLPKVEVFRSSVHATSLPDRDETWLALVGDFGPTGDLPCFGLDEILPLADFLVARLLKPPAQPLATLLVDGKSVALNRFVEQFLARTINGMASSLKGCEQAREITITIRLADHVDR